jgi:predicted MFS family arabinose efflux permease
MTQVTDISAADRRPTLWRNRDFLKLWGAQSISLFGSEITTLALPLTVVTLLSASAWQMGLLSMLGKAPFLLLSLFAGVWLDRVRRHPVLVGADIGRAIVLFSIPLAAIIGVLTFSQLYIVAFVVGALTVVFEIAHLAYVPSLVPRPQLVEANSKLQISHSVAESGGPGVAGLLAQVISAPFAVLIDAVSFLASALLLLALRAPEPARPPARDAAPIRQAVAEGLRALLGHSILRAIIVASILSEGFGAAFVSIYVLYSTRDLQLSPAVIGLIFAIGGVAAVPGALLAQRVANTIGVGNAIIGGWLLEGLARLLIPLAAGSGAMYILMLAHMLMGATGTVANIHQWTFRQNIIDARLHARATASHRFVVYGASAIGALLGGILGTWLGLHTALVVCATGALLGSLYGLCSPLRSVQVQPSDAL